MNELFIQIVAGILVIAISAGVGFLIRKLSENNIGILPKARHFVEKQSYTRLSGKWHLYWIDFNPSIGEQPVWMHGLEEIEVFQNNAVKGFVRLVDHPLGHVSYNTQGEIRAGKMMLTDTRVEDETCMASTYFPNLRTEHLAGIWIGQDDNLRPISAPVILSRNEMSIDELNDTLRQTPLVLIPIGNYGSGIVSPN